MSVLVLAVEFALFRWCCSYAYDIVLFVLFFYFMLALIYAIVLFESGTFTPSQQADSSLADLL